MITYALMCTSNGEKYVYEQLLSIKKQSVKLDKLFLYDFGSTDETISEINKFIYDHKATEISVLTIEKRLGPCWSFLYALKDIEKKIDNLDNSLIYLCDQDDYWFTNKNNNILAFIASKNINIPFLIHHDVFVTDENLNITSNSYYSNSQHKALEKNKKNSFIFNTTIGHTSAINGNLLKYINKLPYDDRFLMHDWIISIIAENFGQKIFYNKKLSYYRQHQNNLIGAKNKSKFNLDKIHSTWKFANKILYQKIAVEESLFFQSNNIQPKKILYLFRAIYSTPGLSQKILALVVTIRFIINKFYIKKANCGK